MRRPRRLLGAALSLVAVLPLAAQSAPEHPDTAPAPALYRQLAPLSITLTADLRRLRADKDTNAPWRPGTFAWAEDAGAAVTVPVRLRTRGVWRLKHCAFPPLRFDFRDRAARGTVFQGVGRPKLVNFCRDDDVHDQYILQEYQLYRLYSLLTPISFRTRLVRMAYVDSGNGRTAATRYAIIAEDPDELAKRLGGRIVKTKGSRPTDLDAEPLALAFLFQYLIGNSDFSFNGLHNTQLVGTADGRILPVAYDFDYSGVVNAAYAIPNAALRITNIRERKFRGPCELAEEYPKLLPLFHQKRDAIYGLWRDEIGRLVHPDRTRRTLEYFDDFYRMIETPESAHRAFLKHCVDVR